jgi:predicted AAA+ superfamily ATPase
MSLRSYVSTYLKEEIQQEAHVRRIDAFARFLEIAAQFHGEQINASTIARSAGVSSQTVGEYFTILEDTLLGWRLPGWSASTHKQLRTTPKFYFFDNGVANALRGELGIQLTERSGRYGKLFEAWVIQEMIRHNSYYNLDLKFAYWRTNSNLEVDVILSRGAGQPIAAIEIKSTTSPESKELIGLDRFHQDYPLTKRLCFCRTPRAFVHQSGVTCMPWQDGIKSLATL